nr:hypothetical protein [Escherichia coli]
MKKVLFALSALALTSTSYSQLMRATVLLNSPVRLLTPLVLCLQTLKNKKLFWVR